jgi:GntR family transcriptional regulator/MocR family aminotransferase
MPETWAISGVDLHVELGRTRVRESLERALREAMQSGQLVPGTLLPPSRALASDLGLARNTIAEVYAQLVAEGWLTARQGSGTRVAERTVTLSTAPSSQAAAPRVIRYDLRPGSPDVANFPRREWLTAARTALTDVTPDALAYGDPRGRLELRAALAEYLARARGVRVSPDSVVVCSGFSQALWLLGRVMRGEGRRRIGVESYGHRHHREVLADAGLEVVGMGVDDHGAQLDHLAGLDAVLLTPAHQFPLGVALDPGRRTSLVQWASSSGALLIEDDYDGEFRYDRRAVGAMQALSPDQVVYAGTASKTLAPGLRLAWLVVPSNLVTEIVETRRLVDLHTAVVDQLTMAEFIRSGRYDRHVRRSRLAYKRRRDKLVSSLAQHAPYATILGLAAGLHVVVGLPSGASEVDVVARGEARGLALEGLSNYALEADGRGPALVIGFATPPAHLYTSALARLCATLSESLR